MSPVGVERQFDPRREMASAGSHVQRVELGVERAQALAGALNELRVRHGPRVGHAQAVPTLGGNGGVASRRLFLERALEAPEQGLVRWARDHALLTAVIAVTMRAILGFQRERANRILGVTGRCGAVTVVQRFGGALNLNIHFHAIVLDGVHVQRTDGSLLFHVLPQVSMAECLALTETIARRVRRLLARQGLLADDAGPPSDETPSALEAWQAASAARVGRSEDA